MTHAQASCFKKAECILYPPHLRKPAGTKVERLSLTQAEVNPDANGTVCDTDLSP